MSSQDQQLLVSMKTSDLTCSICLDILTDPVILSCAHIFCKQCIYKISEPICPNCRAIYDRSLVRPFLVDFTILGEYSPSTSLLPPFPKTVAVATYRGDSSSVTSLPKKERDFNTVQRWGAYHCILNHITEPAQLHICALGRDVFMSFIRHLQPPQGFHKLCYNYGWIYWGRLAGGLLVQLMYFIDPSYLSRYVRMREKAKSLIIVDQTTSLIANTTVFGKLICQDLIKKSCTTLILTDPRFPTHQSCTKKNVIATSQTGVDMACLTNHSDAIYCDLLSAELVNLSEQVSTMSLSRVVHGRSWTVETDNFAASLSEVIH